jgi:flagellar biosynthetic protein FliR/FlhB
MPFFIGVMIFSLAGYIGQFGFLFTTEKLAPDFERISLFSGLSRLVTRETFVELIKSSGKVLVISAILYLVFKGEAQKIIQLGSLPIQDIFRYSFQLMSEVLYVVLIFLAVLGGMDLAYQKWNYWEKMKMTVQEVKDEMKNREGDPHIKSRIRQIQRDRARARMMDDVPKANVVVTNPTHVAVALKYERGKNRAPIVVAKGAGYIAVKIKEIAAESGVPILEKRELARFLYRNVEVNEMIPESLYTAVAEVLAYVYKIKKQFRSFIAQEAV